MAKQKAEQLLEKTGSKLIEWTENAESFANEQVPLVIEEILTYNLVTSLLLCVVTLAVICFVLSFWYGVNKVDEEEWYADCDTKQEEGGKDIASAVLPMFLFLPSIAIFFHQMAEVLKIWLAPRLYILEYLKTFIETGG